MAALARSNSRPNPPVYKDYVNFLSSYSKPKSENSDSSSCNSSSVSLNGSDVADFSYNTYLENSKTKRYQPVKAAKNEEKPAQMRSEIFIEIQAPKKVSEISSVFEKPVKNGGINSKINMFEKQSSVEDGPKRYSTLKKQAQPKPPPPVVEDGPKQLQPKASNHTFVPAPPPPPPVVEDGPKQPRPKPGNHTFVPAPPPPPPVTEPRRTEAPARIQATLVKSPQTQYSVNLPENAQITSEIDRNNPVVKKLVYGALRNLYGNYHDRASDMLATLPRNMVVRSNGLQDRIDQIAASGGLDKLNGRVERKKDPNQDAQ